MAEQANPNLADDSLDLVECVMAIEEALMNRHFTPGQRERLIGEIESFVTPHLAPGERDQLIREFLVRIANGEFGDEGDFDDDAFTALVRKRGPRWSSRSSGRGGRA
jgi:hypothetical protein